MTAVSPSRPQAAPGTRCLVLQMEPTPYIVPRALYLLHDPGLHADLYFTFLNNSQPWGSDAEIGSVPVLLDPSLSRGRRVANVFTLLWKILRGDYTVAHLAGWGHWVVRLVILCCKLRGVPFSVESDSPLRPDLQTPRERLKSLLYPIWMRWITYAIPGGSRQATYFRYYKVPDDKILISHMTVDTDKIRKISSPSKRDFRINRGIPAHQVLFIFVGRLLELKGLDTVLKAFERLQASEPSIALVIVGDGPERAKLEAAAAQYPGRIWLVGREGSEGVIGWLRAADVFVLASRDEHWGLVVNEAMTCGLPVLVSDACGCVDDLVVSGRNGVAFPVDNADKLAESMLKLAVDPELRRRMGSESESMIRPWTIERQAETIRMALVKMSYKK